MQPTDPVKIPNSVHPAQQPTPGRSTPSPQAVQSPTSQTPSSGATPPQPVRSPAEAHALAKKIVMGIVIIVPTLFIVGLVSVMVHYHPTKTVDKSIPKNTIPTSLGTKKVIDRKISTDLGYDITLDEIVTGFRAPYVKDDIEPYIIKITISEPKKPYYLDTEPYPTDFILIVDGKGVNKYSYDDFITDTDLKKAGYAPLESQAITPTTPSSGYIQIGVPKGKTPTALRYKQQKFKVLGGGTLPAKGYDIPIK